MLATQVALSHLSAWLRVTAKHQCTEAVLHDRDSSSITALVTTQGSVRTLYTMTCERSGHLGQCHGAGCSVTTLHTGLPCTA